MSHLKSRWIPVCALALLVLAGGVTAYTQRDTTMDAPKASKTSAPKKFLKDGIDWDSVIGPPPAPDSCQAIGDLAVVRFEQARRTPAEVDASWRGVALDAGTFDQALNARFDNENAPKLHALLREAIDEIRSVNGALKKGYNRPRPFMADPTIIPVVPREEGNSYPSSHATRGLAVALLLADIFPERREALIGFGKQVGYSRVVGGVHYPSDVEAGFRLAERAAAEIIASKAWKKGVEDAADEVSGIRAVMVPSK